MPTVNKITIWRYIIWCGHICYLCCEITYAWVLKAANVIIGRHLYKTVLKCNIYRAGIGQSHIRPPVCWRWITVYILHNKVGVLRVVFYINVFRSVLYQFSNFESIGFITRNHSSCDLMESFR